MTDELAEIVRREPDYTTTDEIAFPAGPPVGRHPTPVEDLTDLPHSGRPTPISIETRKLVIVEWSSVAAAGVTDTTGLVDLDLGRVPANQWWLVDSILARGGAAGQVLVYDAGQVGQLNDQDLLAVLGLAGAGNAGMAAPAACYVKPGRQLLARFLAAGTTPIADALSAGGSQAAPLAGTNIASLGIPPAGVYKVTVSTAVTGAAEPLTSNARLVVGGVAVDTNLPTIPGSPYSVVFDRVTFDGVSNVIVRPVANATAGTVYTAEIVAQMLSPVAETPANVSVRVMYRVATLAYGEQMVTS